MAYQVVYDLTSQGYERWWNPILGLGLSLLFALFIVFREPLQRICVRPFSPAILLGGLVINLALMGIVFFHSYSAYRTVVNDVEAGRVYVVEGCVTQFKPAVPGKGQAADESFVVGTKEFVYSDSPALGFHQTRVYGGPIEDGLNVRVAYASVDGRDIITRLEIAQ